MENKKTKGKGQRPRHSPAKGSGSASRAPRKATFNPDKRADFRPGTLHAPLPAVMVTVGNMEKSNIITVAWTGILSTNPPRAYISVRPTRYSHGLLEECGEFVINLTSEELVYQTDYAGIYTGAKVNKFERLGLVAKESRAVAPPTIAESPLSLECRVFEKISMGTHDVYMADIVNVSVREDLVSEGGRITLDKANLLAYAHGEYFALGKKIGEFGFSAAKRGNPKAKYLKKTDRVSDKTQKNKE